MTASETLTAYNLGLLSQPEARDILLALGDIAGLPVPAPGTVYRHDGHDALLRPIGFEREGWDIPPEAA